MFTFSVNNITLNRDAHATKLALHSGLEQHPLEINDHQTALQTAHPQKSALPNDIEQDPLQVKDLQTHCYQPKDDTQFDCEHMHKDYACFV